jgi:hypothetical protein
MLKAIVFKETCEGDDNIYIIIIIPGLDNPWGSWPTERPPPVGEASANFGG